MPNVDCKRILTVQYLSRLLVDLTIDEEYARAFQDAIQLGSLVSPSPSPRGTQSGVA